jgi:glycosyltransferase involved in cell wall biosynthesis
MAPIMRIAFRASASAVGYFRAGAPCAYLAERGHDILHLHSSVLSHDQQRDAVRTADVVHLSGPFGHYDDAPEEFKARRGVLSVDLDDDVWCWKDDPASKVVNEHIGKDAAGGRPVTPERAAELESWLKAADVVTTTTDHLAEVLRAHGAQNVRVCPNAIAPEMQRQRPKRSTSEVLKKAGFAGSDRVVAWTGSVAHVADLPPVLEALARVGSVDPTVHVRSLGPVDFGQSPGFARNFRGTYSPVIHRAKPTDPPSLFVPFEAYYETLEAMAPNVAVIAARPSPFNASKSAVTLYSWAVQGVPCIVSDFGPYTVEKERGFPGIYVDHANPEAWTLALRDLLYDTTKAERIGAEAKEHVLKHHAYPSAADAWENAWAEAVRSKQR